MKRQVQIRNKQWKIKVVDELQHQEDGSECFGLCVYDERTIYILKHQNKHELIDTMIHELLHAVMFEFGFLPDEEMNEKVVRELTKAFLHCFEIKIN